MADRSSLRLALLAVAVPLAVLGVLDLGLSWVGWVPPDDPLLFFARSRAQAFDPFVRAEDGALEIRSDWVNDGLGLRGRVGKRAGRQFLLPGFRPVRIRDPKPPGLLRVMVLGGSTTYGLYVGARDAFAPGLEAGLRRRFVEREVEVINLGCAGFASDRVLGLLDRVWSLEPDLVVVLAGHNEMLGGHRGPASDLSPALRLRARLLRVSTLFAWWNHALASTLRGVETEQVREEVAALEAGQIPTYVPEAVPASARVTPDAGFRARAAERYARHMDAMLTGARDAGVPLLVAVPAANLRWPPGLSVHADGFEARAAFDSALRAGLALLESGRAGPALERFEAAASLSPEHAGAQFARADALRSLGRIDEALAAYQLALDRDVRTHRITGDLERVLLQTLEARGAHFVDTRPLFHRLRDDEPKLFVDHLHPTAEGHARIAEILLPEAGALLVGR